jgi:ABC-type multidrug transport system fused ATPase/permease subunit
VSSLLTHTLVSTTKALFFYPMLIDSLANGKNALRRISSYLSAEELTPYVQTLPPVNGEGGIEMENGNFLWSSANPSADGNIEQTAAPALCRVDLAIKPGEIVAVVGSVGSGKTALIKGLLGELSPVPLAVVDSSMGSGIDSNAETLGILEKPSVIAHGNTAYCSQEAWLPKGTLRDAVVFGREYDEERYRGALRDAGLDEDIADSIEGSNSKEAASRGVLSHETDVGEGGSNLSGGQRARVALARALYAGEDTKVFLLDDPLAALDAAVGSTVFDRLTVRLRRSKAATLLVTNDPNIPRRCDRVVLMGKYNPASPSCSTVIDIGTYDELLERGHDLRSLSSSEVAAGDEDTDVGEDQSEASAYNRNDGRSSHNNMMHSMSNMTDGYIQVSTEFENCTQHTQHADPDCVECMKGMDNYIADQVIPVTPDVEDTDFTIRHSEMPQHQTSEDKAVATVATVAIEVEVSTAPEEATKKLVSADDMMAKGFVPFSAYVMYLKSVRKPLLLVAMVFSYLMSNGAQFFQQYIVSKWTELGRGDALAEALGGQYLNSLVKAAGVVSVFLWFRSFLTMRVGIEASDFLHDKMLNSVFKAPMSFFDATPSGQLLSRFGKEMETVDSALPDGIGSVLFCFLQIGMSTAALAGVITPAMLIPLSLVGIFYGKTMGRFRPAARDLKRSESRTRSPVYTHFGEALRGKETIRSIPSANRIWSSQHQGLTDQNLSVYYSVKALDRWLSIRLETLGNVVVFTAAVVSVFLTRAGRLKAGSAGWGLTQAMAITGLLTWAVRTLTDLETHMMSMMRVQELTDLDSVQAKGLFEEDNTKKQTMPKEKQAAGEALVSLYTQPPKAVTAPISDAALVASGWPWQGNIEFNDVSIRYNEISPLVLKNVSITVPPGTTLGVVGRTGSGKSSLLLTLFRMIELEGGGNIKIDSIDIRSVSLQTLRESLSIIPQDPVLFAGTLMYNLDATGKASQQAAWAALEAASPELAKQFRAAGTGLDTYISEGGKNLSSGQRQLVCLARALMRKSKILVMDEATSSVDSQTDAKVQETIRREFVNKGVTVLTVAHRLDTVLGYDKIAVLGAGELIEYGSPGELLEKTDGEFRRLVMQDRRNKKKGAASQASKKKSDAAVGV